MAAQRQTPTLASEGGLIGDNEYATRVKEEVSALWQRSIDTLASVAGTNTITAMAGATLIAYGAGVSFWLTPANTNTGAVTLNVDGLGARNVRDRAGVALPAGALVAGTRYLLVDDGTQFRVAVHDGDLTNGNWVPQGAWLSVTNYEPLDVVTRNGVTYIAIAANVNDAPPSANWVVLVEAFVGGTLTQKLNASPSAVGGAGFNIGNGSTPGAPVQGDMWGGGDSLLMRGASGSLSVAWANFAQTFSQEQTFQRAGNTARFINTTNGANVEVLRIEGDRSAPADNDIISYGIYGSNDAGEQTLLVAFKGIFSDVSDGTEDAALLIGLIQNGSMVDELLLTGSALAPNANGGLSLGFAGNRFSSGFMDQIQLGHDSDTTITRTGAGAIAVEGVGVALNSTSGAHTASSLEIGHATDTTLARVSAGIASIESCQVLTAGAAQANMLYAPQIAIRITGVNFNSANTDNAISITLPPGFSRYRIGGLEISGASASITTATFGLFTATGGGGTAILAAGQAITVSSASENAANNAQFAFPASGSTQTFNVATIYFRVGTAQGSAATANVTLILNPV